MSHALPDAYRLRALAEEAMGTRNKLICLVGDNLGGLTMQACDSNGCPPPGAVAMFYTEDYVPGRQAPDKVTITISGQDRTLDGYDTLFWSESSWDKFVKPYYERLMSEEDFDKMWTAVHNPAVVALVHLPKSQYVAMRGPAVVAFLDGEIQVLDSYIELLTILGLLVVPVINGPVK
jgi:hypothetical protein